MNDVDSLAHTKWRCQYHLVFAPKYRRQIAIIMAIKEQPFLTRDDLAKEVGVSLATLKREISILRKNGYIGRGGSNKNGQWLLLKKICK